MVFGEISTSALPLHKQLVAPMRLEAYAQNNTADEVVRSKIRPDSHRLLGGMGTRGVCEGVFDPLP